MRCSQPPAGVQTSFPWLQPPLPPPRAPSPAVADLVLVRSMKSRSTLGHGAGTVLLAICVLLFGNFSNRTVVAATETQQDENPALSALGIPKALRPQWRKFGLWDYKQTDSKYRDFTKFNFGATGRAANISGQQLLDWSKASRPTPTDLHSITHVELDSRFAIHRKQLEKVRTMAQVDRTLVRIAGDFTWLAHDKKWPRTDIGFGEDRWNNYRDLFRKIGLQEGVLRSADYPGAIFFIVHARGIVTGGASVGYVYSESEPTPLTKSPGHDLDALARTSGEKGSAIVFRKLAAKWYAFYELDW